MHHYYLVTSDFEVCQHRKMEKPLVRQLDELMNTPGVTGVLCTDTQGLGLGAKGVAQKKSAGMVSSLAQQAAQLHPDASTVPTVCIETDSGNILVKSHNDVTMAIYKTS